MQRSVATMLGLTLCALAALAPATTRAQASGLHYRPGAQSLHDPYEPGLGNGGYDVLHYGIVLSYAPATGVLTGSTTVTAAVTQNLSRFDLDFALPVRSVFVNGIAAQFVSQNYARGATDRELVITPAAGLRAGTGMSVVVRYAANPAKVVLGYGAVDWSQTITGYSVWDEPNAASEWWYPANAYPSDKATYDVTVTTPNAYTAISNGRLLSRKVNGTSATTHWATTSPMASYLAVLTIGKYEVLQGTVLNGIPAYYAFEDGLGTVAQRARNDVLQTPEVLSFLQSQWGAYPFDAAGGTVIGSFYTSSLETQTRPTYQSGLWEDNTDNLWVILHENAHQWFGDDVTTRTWSDCWLAEGFATYSEWLWSQARHEGTPQQLFLSTYHLYPADHAIWALPLNQPSYPIDIEVYDRGAMLLQALRNRVGTNAFFAILHNWLNVHRNGNGDSGDFVTLAESMTHADLTSFFQAWLYGRDKPAPTVADGFPAGVASQLTAGAMVVPPSLAAIQRTDTYLAG
jgi:aminopeptidase N